MSLETIRMLLLFDIYDYVPPPTSNNFLLGSGENFKLGNGEDFLLGD
jgi:hypothetical protein